ncbi:MAG: 2-oxo acid dehydrogenase subunit E2, partial [Crocinitomicaceae bacterium]|nr:2-oxo acid dehydrogenase subunit E2 [Crocinitomicaceae bacterium]
MAQIEIRLPKMGESVTEATITNWLKNIGDTIEMDEPLVEVATDKVDNELPSEAEGILVKQLFDTDEVAQVGDVIAIISTDGDSSVAEASSAAAEVEVTSNTAAAEIVAEVEIVAANVNGSVTM